MLSPYLLYVVVLVIACVPIIVIQIGNMLHKMEEDKKHKAFMKQQETRQNLYINRLNKNLSKKKK
jgi:hypothetical protein